MGSGGPLARVLFGSRNLSDFQKLFDLTEENFTQFLKCCEKLKKEEKPEEGLKKIVEALATSKTKNCL